MIAAVAVIPSLIGWLSTRLIDPSERPRGAGPFARTLLQGYPFTLGLALTLTVMTIFAPVVRLRALARRWTIQHVPIIVKPEDYPDVVSDVQRALRAGGLETEPRPASWMLRMPTKFLALFARSAVAPLVADFLTTLVAPSIEVLVHPSDIVIMGRDLDAARARAILAEHLTYTKAYLTWTKEANQIEERLGALWRSPTSVASARRQLAEIDGQLRSLKLSYEEWEILFRQRLLIDRQLSVAAQIIPVIDFSDCFAGVPGARELVAAELRRALERVGFFIIVGHGVPPRLIERTFSEARRFHDQPLDVKMALRMNEHNNGYMM